MGRYIIDNRPEEIDFRKTEGMLQRTIQNAKNLLMTRKGEVPYDRLRGLDPAIFDLPIPKMQEALIPELDRVMLWEPDAEVISAQCHLDENGEAIIRVELEIDIEA